MRVLPADTDGARWRRPGGRARTWTGSRGPSADWSTSSRTWACRSSTVSPIRAAVLRSTSCPRVWVPWSRGTPRASSRWTSPSPMTRTAPCSWPSWTNRTERCWGTCDTRSATTTGTCWSTEPATPTGSGRLSVTNARHTRRRSTGTIARVRRRAGRWIASAPTPRCTPGRTGRRRSRTTSTSGTRSRPRPRGASSSGGRSVIRPRSPGSCPWTTSTTGTSASSPTTGPASRPPSMP